MIGKFTVEQRIKTIEFYFQNQWLNFSNAVPNVYLFPPQWVR